MHDIICFKKKITFQNTYLHQNETGGGEVSGGRAGVEWKTVLISFFKFYIMRLLYYFYK